MKRAAEYRVMAEKCFKWSRTYMDEVREMYLQLAQFWLDLASKPDGPSGWKMWAGPTIAVNIAKLPELLRKA
jgi:hypothetical protein